MCAVGLGAVARDVPAWGEVEEQQVDHQGHRQQHGLQFQAHPQENGACNEAQDAAAGVVLQVGTVFCVNHLEQASINSPLPAPSAEGSKARCLHQPWPTSPFQQRSAGKLMVTSCPATSYGLSS